MTTLMTTAFRMLFALIVLVTLAACNAASATPTPTVTPPPTLEAIVVDPPTPLPTATEVVIATLPPEWTPTPLLTPLPTETLTPVPTFDMINAMLLTSPTLPACAAFLIDDANTASAFNRSEDVRVSWNPINAALAYRISLYDQERNLLFTAIVGETTFSFGRALFQPLSRYFWEVRPFDSAGTQLCAAMGGLLTPVN